MIFNQNPLLFREMLFFMKIFFLILFYKKILQVRIVFLINHMALLLSIFLLGQFQLSHILHKNLMTILTLILTILELLVLLLELLIEFETSLNSWTNITMVLLLALNLSFPLHITCICFFPKIIVILTILLFVITFLHKLNPLPLKKVISLIVGNNI